MVRSATESIYPINKKKKTRNRVFSFYHRRCAASDFLPGALVEQNQNADGSVIVPEVLRKYVGTDIIKK